LGSEVIFWKDVSPSYSQQRFVLWNDFFVDVNKDLLFMWFLFLHEGGFLTLNDAYDHIFFFIDKCDRLMKKEHREYLRAANIQAN
jgi:hypothetical protein